MKPILHFVLALLATLIAETQAHVHLVLELYWALLQNNLLIYGVGGIIVPFVGIKLIDLILVGLHLA